MLESNSKSNCHVVHLSTHYLAVVGLKVCEMITVGGGAAWVKPSHFSQVGSPKIVKPLVYIWNGSSVILRNYWFMSDVTHPYNFHCGCLHHDELFVLSTFFLSFFFRFHRRGKWITQWCHFGTKVWKGTNTQNNFKQHTICHLPICLSFKTKTK